MAWGDLAKVGQLLSSLGQLSDTTGAWKLVPKQARGKGAGKGAGKDSDKGNGKGSSRQCPWDGCKSAERNQATWGGVPNCHCCKKSFARTPPVEQMVDWAYPEMLAKQQGPQKDKGSSKGGAGKGAVGKGATGKGGKGGTTEATAAEQTELLAQRRLLRQAELKTAKENAGRSAGATVTPMQEVAKTFNSTSTGGTKTYDLDKELTLETEQLGALAAKVVLSLKAEVLPGTDAAP